MLKQFLSCFKFTQNGLTFKQKFRLSLPGPLLSIGNVMIHNVFIKYYTDIIGLDPKYVGWIYVIYNIWNALNDPIFGAWIDKMKYNPKRGKYVYLMRVTVPVMVISSWAMILSSPSWSEWLIFFVYTFELFIYDTAATAYNIAYRSYMLIVAPTREERVDVGILQNYVAQVLSFFITMIPTLLLVGDGKREVIIPIFSLVILVECVFFWISLRSLEDNKELYETISDQKTSVKEILLESKDILKSRAFITYVLYSVLTLGCVNFYFTPYLYYMDHVINSSGIIATVVDATTHIIVLLFLPLMGTAVKQLGTKKSVYLGTIPALFGFLGVFFAKSIITVWFSYIFIVFTVNYLATCTSPIGALIIDEDERVTGIRKTGLFNGLYAIFVTAFSSLQTVVFTNIISAFGYDGTAKVQSASAVLGIRIATGLLPLVAVLIGLVPMVLYPYSKKKEEEISEFSNTARRGKPEEVKV